MSTVLVESASRTREEADVERFRGELGPFVVAVETTRMPMLFTDAVNPNHIIVFANNAFLTMSGYDREEVIGRSFTSLVVGSGSTDTARELDAAFSESDSNLEICYRRKDGSEFWACVLISPVRNKHGVTDQHFVSVVDQTKHKQDQAHSKMLIDELNHRVKNTLSTVQSIVVQALRTPADHAVIRESVESRLLALARSHDLLISDNWQGAGLRDLVCDVLEPFGVTGGRAQRFRIVGDNVRISAKMTLGLAIGLHELATNAVKYGALSNDAGSILIGWTVRPDPRGDRLRLRWQEKDGPAVKPQASKGFGSWVLQRGLPHEMDGTVRHDCRPSGVVCTIDIPLPRGTRGG
jgi:PAS domain S-box-containing protein